MTQLVALGLQVAVVVRVGSDLDRNRIHDFNAIT